MERPGEIKKMIVKVAVQVGCVKLETEVGSSPVLRGRSGHEFRENRD